MIQVTTGVFRSSLTAAGLCVAGALLAGCGAVTQNSAADTPSQSPSGAASAGPGGFYRYPDGAKLDAASDGELIERAPMDVSAPLREAGTGATRLMYRSQGAGDKAVAVTGFLLRPKGKAPEGGWPVVAWAHGTAGVGADCAPSRRPNLYSGPDDHYEQLITRLLKDGYAVVGTDYPGLGFSGRTHGYLQLGPESRSVADSVRAAREVSGDLGEDWFSVGHSQGGAAALGAGELAGGGAGDPHYRGTVSLAPASNLDEVMKRAAALEPPLPKGWGEGAAYLSYLAVGAHLSDPSAPYAAVLAPRLVRQIPATEELCLSALGEHLEGLDPTPTALVDADWADNAPLRRFLAQAHPAHARSAGPVLLLQGGEDRAVPQRLTDTLRGQLCGLGDTVEYRTYAKADHDELLNTSYRDLSAWLKARLKGDEAPTNCPA